VGPALVMWAAGRGSRRFPLFAGASHFAVHVLSAAQAKHRSACARDARALRDVPYRAGLGGVPLLPDCLARFECERHAYHDAGDHVIVVGKVRRVGTADGDALTFFAGKVGQFAQR